MKDDRESGAGPALLCSPAPERVVASRTWTFGHGGPTVEAGTEFTLQPPTCFAAGYESAAGLVILAWEAANRIRIGDLVDASAEGHGCRASRHTLDPLVGRSDSPAGAG